MSVVGERYRETIQPGLDRSISIDFTGATITSDAEMLHPRQADERFEILEKAASGICDPRSAARTCHSVPDLLLQRVYQVDAAHEDCNDADCLRIDPALRLATGKSQTIAVKTRLLI